MRLSWVTVIAPPSQAWALRMLTGVKDLPVDAFASSLLAANILLEQYAVLSTKANGDRLFAFGDHPQAAHIFD